MQLVHDVRRLGHCCDHVVGEGRGMRRGESYAFQTVNLAARAQQLGEGKPVADAVAEGVHILAQQRDFLGAFVHALADFGEDVSGTAVMFLAARGRHDAEGAGVVAAYGDGHPARHLRRTVGWQLAWEVVEFLLHLHLRVAFDAGLVEQLRQGSDVLGTEHGVDPRGFFRDLLTVELRHAAADRDLQVRAFPLQFGPQSDGAVHAFGGVFAHRAGVHDDQVDVMVEILFLGGGHVAVGLKHAGDAFGIMHIHLASERMHVEHALAARGGIVRRRFGQFRGTLRLGHHVFVHNAPCYRQGGTGVSERGNAPFSAQSQGIDPLRYTAYVQFCGKRGGTLFFRDT